VPSSLVSAHRRPESVLVIVYTDAGDVLLLQRRAPFEFWQSVTGSLDPGESPLHAARRELAEETGLTIEGQLVDRNFRRTFTIDPRWRDRYAPRVTENIEHECHYRLSGPLDIRIDEDEHRGFRWLSVEEAIEAVWSWTNRDALLKLSSELRKRRDKKAIPGEPGGRTNGMMRCNEFQRFAADRI
jgi:dATP pyrophosphohydrolase